MMAPRRFRLWLVAVVAAQILYLLVVPAGRALLVRTGASALLETAPYDPRHLTMGDYVELNYKVSDLDFTRLASDVTQPVLLRPRQDVFVVWEQSGQYHQATGLFASRPQAAPHQLVVRARVLWSTDSTVRVAYGIERFYVPQGTGRDIEAPDNLIEVAVRVGRNGTVAIERVLVGGER